MLLRICLPLFLLFTLCTCGRAPETVARGTDTSAERATQQAAPAPDRANQSDRDDRELKFYDNTYVDYIKTVRLHVNGFIASQPIITLGANAQLRLSFDDLSDEVRRYTYRFIHCDRDWTPSSLGALEYNPGYATDYIDEYDFSLRTLTPYVHYDLVFPNRNMRIERSGNYLLVVYDSEEDDVPVITRRFMVEENLVNISGQVVRPVDIDKIHTHQEVDFVANTKQVQPRAPLRELSATVLQNNRWDNAIVDVPPNLIGNEQVQFNYQGRILFRGGNEFRPLDIRSIQAPRTEMASIETTQNGYEMMMVPDPERANSVYLNYNDFNGDFITMSFDRPVIDIADDLLQRDFERFNLDFTGQYIDMTFLLKMNAPSRRDVYLFGALSEWQLKPGLRMVWNDAISSYVGRTRLKQGYYSYYYVTDEGPGPNGRNVAGYNETEDSFTETENDYTVLIYYRPIGGRYDRLVGVGRLNSVFNR